MSVLQSVFPDRDAPVVVNQLTDGSIAVRFRHGGGHTSVHVQDLDHLYEVITALRMGFHEINGSFDEADS